MDIALLLARLALAAIFVLAGSAKLADLEGSRQALRDFGVPTRLARPLGLILPLGELAVAMALIFPASAWWGALGALALLLLFLIGIGYNLARGRTPNCHCFGQLHSAPVGWSTLLRNLILIGIAGFVVGFGRTATSLSPFTWFTALPPIQRIELPIGVILLGFLALEGWLLFHTMRQQGRLLLRLEELEEQLASAGLLRSSSLPPGLPIGSPAPIFHLASLSSNNHSTETITLERLRARGKPIVLVFSDPNCGPCRELFPEVARWQHNHPRELTLELISQGTTESNREKASEYGIAEVLLQRKREVAEAYQVDGTPSAVLVLPDGTIGSFLAQGVEAIRDLIAQAMKQPVLHPLTVLPNDRYTDAGDRMLGQLPQLAVGEPAPVFTLPDLRGKMTGLADFRGEKTLVLFWNPACGFCQRMLADLKAWEANPPGNAPRLLIVSTGTVEANQALGLSAPIVLDESFNTAHRFGADGTPMAVLVNADGTIASQVVGGAPAVLALAGGRSEAESTRMHS